MPQVEIPFNKGLNASVNHLSANQGQCLTFADFQLDYGVLNERGSTHQVTASAIGSSTDDIDGLFFWADPSQATSTPPTGNLYINDFSNSKFYRSSLYAPSSDGSITVTDITNSIGQNQAPITFDSLNGILIYTGSGGAVNKITSHTANCAVLGGSPPSTGIVKVVNNFCFLAGTQYGGGSASTFSRVYWSNVGDPETWPASSFIDFRLNDGNCVTALGELNGNLLIFKQTSIGLLSTTTQSIAGTVTLGPLSTLFKGIGVLSPHSVDSLPDGRCVFLASDMNVYVTDGSTLDCLTNQPPPGLNVIDAINATGPTLNNATFLKYLPLRNEIIIAGQSGAGSTSFMYAYDMIQNYWRQITGMVTKSMAVVRYPNNSSTSPKATSVLLTGTSVGTIIDVARDKDLTPTDFMQATVTASVSTSIQFPGNLSMLQPIYLTILYTATSNATFTYGFDGNYTGTNYTLPSASVRLDHKINVQTVANSKRPTTFQINFNPSVAGLSIFKVYLSDEAND